MLRLIRATAARSSRTSFSFSSTRNLSTAAVQASVANAFLLQNDSFVFLRKFTSSHRHDSASDLPSSPKIENNGASVSSSSSTSAAHRETSEAPRITYKSTHEGLYAYDSENAGGDAGGEVKSEAELDEDLEFDDNVARLTNASVSTMPAGQESEPLSGSESVYEDEEDEEEAFRAGGDSESDAAVESNEEFTVDMSKVPEDLKEMMDDSYVCESAEEELLSEGPLELLTLDEVNQVLEEVRARDVKVFPVQDRCEWTDVMVIATGISDRHVRGIADALVYKIKKKGIVDSPLYPTIEGQLGGKWLVVDCGNIVIHVLNEESRAYYRLEELWTGDVKPSTIDKDFETMLNRAGIKDAVP